MPSHPLRGSSPEGRARGRYRPPQGRHAASGGSSVISVKRTIFRAATPQAAGGRPLRVPRNAAFYCRDRRPRRSAVLSITRMILPLPHVENPTPFTHLFPYVFPRHQAPESVFHTLWRTVWRIGQYYSTTTADFGEIYRKISRVGCRMPVLRRFFPYFLPKGLWKTACGILKIPAILGNFSTEKRQKLSPTTQSVCRGSQNGVF